MASVGISSVLETLGVNVRAEGSLAGAKFSPVPGPCRRSRLEVDKGLEVRTAYAATLGTLVRIAGIREAMADSGSHTLATAYN